MADELLVMQLGKVVEQGPARDVLGRPRHPYTRALVSAIPGQVVGQLAHRAHGRPAFADEPAVGLPVPDSLLARC